MECKQELRDEPAKRAAVFARKIHAIAVAVVDLDHRRAGRTEHLDRERLELRSRHRGVKPAFERRDRRDRRNGDRRNGDRRRAPRQEGGNR